MGLEQTKHEYIDRDMSPELLTLIRFAESVSPRVVGVLVVVGTIHVSRYVLGLGRRLRSFVSASTRVRNPIPAVTGARPPVVPRRRSSDPGPEALPRGAGGAIEGGGPNAPLTGLAQLLREGLRNRGGLWARVQWR